MIRRCPQCKTVVTVEEGTKPVCPNCWYGAPNPSPDEGPEFSFSKQQSTTNGQEHQLETPHLGSSSQTTVSLVPRLQQFEWRRLLFMEPVLAFVSEGRLFGRATAITLRTLAVFSLLGGLGLWIASWIGVRPDAFLPTSDKVAHVLGWIVFQAVFLVATYMVAHILFLRARDVASVPQSEFTVIPIGSVLLRVTGEVWAALAVAVGVGGGLMTMISGTFTGGFLDFLPFLGSASGGLVGGLLFMFTSLLIAVAVLLLFYFLAEAAIVAVDIARNTAAVRRHHGNQEPVRTEQAEQHLVQM